MLDIVSRHIKDLSLIKQILYGFSGLIVVRNMDDIYIHVYFSKYNINKYKDNNLMLSKNMHDIFDKKIAKYYKSCGENAINSNNIFISKKIYTTSGKEYEGLLYFCPYIDKKNNNIIGSISYGIEIDYLKNIANTLFNKNANINNKDYNLHYLYYNLTKQKELFDEIIKIINKLNLNRIIHNNIILIAHLKNTLNNLLDNLKYFYYESNRDCDVKNDQQAY